MTNNENSLVIIANYITLVQLSILNQRKTWLMQYHNIIIFKKPRWHLVLAHNINILSINCPVLRPAVPTWCIFSWQRQRISSFVGLLYNPCSSSADFRAVSVSVKGCLVQTSYGDSPPPPWDVIPQPTPRCHASYICITLANTNPLPSLLCFSFSRVSTQGGVISKMAINTHPPAPAVLLLSQTIMF